MSKNTVRIDQAANELDTLYVQGVSPKEAWSLMRDRGYTDSETKAAIRSLIAEGSMMF